MIQGVRGFGWLKVSKKTTTVSGYRVGVSKKRQFLPAKMAWGVREAEWDSYYVAPFFPRDTYEVRSE